MEKWVAALFALCIFAGLVAFRTSPEHVATAELERIRVGDLPPVFPDHECQPANYVCQGCWESLPATSYECEKPNGGYRYCQPNHPNITCDQFRWTWYCGDKLWYSDLTCTTYSYTEQDGCDEKGCL
jgi:hypothetical protein